MDSVDYEVRVKTVTERSFNLSVDIPEILSGNLDTIDKVMHERSAKGSIQLEELPEDGKIIEETTKVVEVYRGQKRVFPREQVRKAKQEAGDGD